MGRDLYLAPELSMAIQDTLTAQTPAELGFAMPAEWERHEATWLGWPHNPTDWPGKLDTIRWVYGEMVRKISPGEIARILVRNQAEEKLARSHLTRSGTDLNHVQFIPHPTNRGWMRDSGPIFVRKRQDVEKTERRSDKPQRKGIRTQEPRVEGRGSRVEGPGNEAPPLDTRRSTPDTRHSTLALRSPETAIVDFHFNAWAKYDDWQKDRRVPAVAARLLGKRLFQARCRGRDFVIEGGGIDVNGQGALLTTQECYLDAKVQVRNPGLGRKEIEETLEQYLGVTKVLWLASGPAGDDTHGHIDDVCRFVNRNTVVLVKETNPRDINYRPLAENWERIRELRLEDGSKPEVVPLPMPAPLYFDGCRLPASYANFYISNAAVLVPTFNDPNDRIALGTLGDLFNDRPVAGIHAVDLVLGFGTLHCLTQQQPA
jgi:agmatine deiminase